VNSLEIVRQNVQNFTVKPLGFGKPALTKEAARLLQCALGRGQSRGRGGWLLWNGSDRTNSFEQPAITEITAREQAAGQR
jgi:hypothetical protein